MSDEIKDLKDDEKETEVEAAEEKSNSWIIAAALKWSPSQKEAQITQVMILLNDRHGLQFAQIN